MVVTPTEIPDVKIVRPEIQRDDRGYFMETYHSTRYRESGIDACFVQDNESKSSRGVFRGLHWQVGEFAQAKLVRVIRGAVWDVLYNGRDLARLGKHGIAVEVDGRIAGQDVDRKDEVVSGGIYDDPVRIPKRQCLIHLFCRADIEPTYGPLQSAGFSVKTVDFQDG